MNTNTTENHHYQYPQPPAQQQEPKKRKKHTWVWIVLGVVAVALIAQGAGSSDSDNSATTASSATNASDRVTTAQETPQVATDSNATLDPKANGNVAAPTSSAPLVQEPTTAPETVAGINTPVRDGDFEFVVTAVGRGEKTIGDEYLNTTAQGEFVLVTLSVSNIGNEPGSFFGDTAYLFDLDGRKFSASTDAAIYLDDSNAFYEEINPGNTLTGIIAFDVPVGSAIDTIELHDSMFSEGVSVKL